MESQQENIRKGNFYFPEYISFSQSSVHTTGKFELTGKMSSLRAS